MQSLTYPLVAMVAARAPGGALNTAGLSQCSAIIGLLWALGNGMHTAGMVYARTREGFRQFTQVNYWITAGMVCAYLILMIPPVSNYLFDVLMGLPATVAAPAKRALLFSLPMTIMFFWRTPDFVLMYASGKTYLAFFMAVIRVLLALALAMIFIFLNVTGIFWAVFCLTVAITAETIFLRKKSGDSEYKLPSGAVTPRRREILGFSLTLSAGAAMLSLSGFMIGAFIARAPMPERILPVYYLVLAVHSTLAAGIIRIQTLTLAFYGASRIINRRLLTFALVSGSVMGMGHLILLNPHLLRGYYSVLQGLPEADLSLVKITSCAMAFYAPSVALRSYAEGVAAYHKKPMVVLTGQAVYLAMVAVCAFFALNMRVSGNLIGPVALFIANALGAGAIFLAMRWESRSDLPVPDTILAQGPR